ncbi:UDP-glucose 4-epimerase family protein [Sansalvadorimonas verongulae]|uniref:UDP-glucose 4-epimerase family protein n=1 Tax=Sansalvadorimonas verongulae TaxID=2172824 RepID=UPI0012BC7604|nr:SDR family oxidoreductase [Sansalvadorimonas verongulae]MTI11944.1 SDR family oxidoreductase [Sansalvadorimonas verongulae]
MKEKTNVLVTGATGFIGKSVLSHLLGCERFNVEVALRSNYYFDLCKAYFVGDINKDTFWLEALTNQSLVIHIAARAHVMKGEILDPLIEYRRVNVDGTYNLARQAAAAGVKRFVFISSIGVNGSVNTNPFTESDDPSPTKPYAQSKLEAEQRLWDVYRDTGMEIVIIRPPLVYGPSAPGNFGRLVSLVEKGIPMPFGAIYNRRSYIALDNLVHLIITCMENPAAANQIFLASDGDDLSTTEFLRRVAFAMGKPSRLISVPSFLLMLGTAILGKRDLSQRLFGSLQIDISKARNLLGWEPPISVDEGLRRCFDKSDSKEVTN